MNRLTKAMATLLILIFAVPMPLLVVPQSVQAQFEVIDTSATLQRIDLMVAADIAASATTETAFETAISAIKNTVSAIADVSTAANTLALRIKDYVLDPLAFVLSGNLLRSITAGVIDFINGKTNGTGRPQFVQDLNGHLLSVGDAQAFAFFAEFGRNSNSPFAASILSSLRTNYLQGTSAAGFWAANRSTLPQYSANPVAFVRGDFFQGNWAAYFALITQPQNNPYVQYYRAQARLSALVANATSNTLHELAWGQGFLSWCGPTQTATADNLPDSVVVTSENSGLIAGRTAALDEGNLLGGIKQDVNKAGLTNFSENANGSYSATGNTGYCPDGSKIKTPGSVIRDTLSKVLGTDIDKLIQMGDVGADVNTIFSNLASIMQTVGYGASLLGAGGSGGLLGFGQSSGGQPSLGDRYRSQPGYLGLTQNSINQGATNIPQTWQDQKVAADQAESQLPPTTQQQQGGTGKLFGGQNQQ
ncbi:MAG: hypothetical protein Q7R54_03180 [bacterium]|nr:hypothetical protein [bacterium]